MKPLDLARFWLDTPARILADFQRRQARDGDDDPDVEVLLETGPDPARDPTAGHPFAVPRREPLPRKPPDPIAVGQPDEPELAELLWQMGEVWAMKGMRESHITPAEFCTMPKTPRRAVAIPPLALWPWTADFLREVWTPLRQAIGPMSVRGYRPPAYNKAVDGSPRSDHQWAIALDLRPAGGQSVDLLKKTAARFYLQNGARLKMGLGIYSNNIHVGAFMRQRHWGDAAAWIKHVKRSG
jgi:hypothetical protein